MLLEQQYIPDDHEDLLGIRTDTPYTEAERSYSAAVQSCLEVLLEGRRQQLVLLRRYHQPPQRLEVMPAPLHVDRAQLRLPMVERILVSTLAFVRDVSPGGCVFQALDGDQLVETQHFSTKYPHIVIERVDAFDHRTRIPLYTEWRLRRLQNQRAETQLNRWLDAANLALSVVKALRNGRK
jgi:hypothetical protein